MKKNRNQVICPYCGAQALLRKGSFVYEKPFINHLYVCVRYPACDAYVAAHEISLEPMGSLANAALRKKRRIAHEHFDKIWRNGIFSRKDAYKWLRDKLGVSAKSVHIGAFGEGFCELIANESKKILEKYQLLNTQQEGGGQ